MNYFRLPWCHEYEKRWAGFCIHQFPAPLHDASFSFSKCWLCWLCLLKPENFMESFWELWFLMNCWCATIKRNFNSEVLLFIEKVSRIIYHIITIFAILISVLNYVCSAFIQLFFLFILLLWSRLWLMFYMLIRGCLDIWGLKFSAFLILEIKLWIHSPRSNLMLRIINKEMLKIYESLVLISAAMNCSRSI